MEPKVNFDAKRFLGQTFDYIVCGGGTSGCVIAAELASIPNVSVLLVEAGRDSGLAPDVLVPGKYVKQLQEDKEGLWELETFPQAQLNARKLKFLRGKQLGGSSAVNYMALARGPAADYDEWAKVVGDDGWKWKNILPLMRELEEFDSKVPADLNRFAAPKPADHGTSGQIAFGDEMVPGIETFINACSENKIPLCPDINSGNPVGVGLAQFNVRDGQRDYAANTFLGESARASLKNLTILLETECDKVHSKDGVVTGVDLYHRPTGTQFHVYCREEAVLCAGTFGSPRILMLSGIASRDTLERLEIPVQVDLPGCGQNMRDHSIITCEYKVNNSIPAHNQLFLNPGLLAEAEAQYAKSHTGPLAMYGSSGTLAFPRIQRLLESEEFSNLSDEEKKFMMEPTRPSAEIWLGSGPSVYQDNSPEQSYMTHELLLQNNLSLGTVMIRSKNPRDQLIVHPNFMAHPFDRRIAIETVRMALKIASTKAYQGVIERMVHGPKIDLATADLDAISDEVMLDFIRKNLDQGYHSMSTCRMGKSSDPEAVVDVHFQVMGMKNLRVADLSVCPILTCNHTQINAYLIGLRCARDIIETHRSRKQLAKL
ncbi:glucose-methanol-choline oxidoreductase [Penicillium macrosclerotiorum]|uniref:glucose-methanol-choline oxidoreductase n=1 Tax=Penicillium macrosclerotiorum TaxID=303699 RepID=UPI00254904E8|nr:glucose-methanol-choline oxidoreductase [Penicillium macrosclerotiorum]KAJ5689949.1 glucose-methanol-choline oxidoreductase [Penicillium macrosclerotiorum]